jgi:hypothetical protein
MSLLQGSKQPNADGGLPMAGAVLYVRIVMLACCLDGSRRRRIGGRDLLKMDYSGRCKADGDHSKRWYQLNHSRREHGAERLDGGELALDRLGGVAVDDVVLVL